MKKLPEKKKNKINVSDFFNKFFMQELLKNVQPGPR